MKKKTSSFTNLLIGNIGPVSVVSEENYLDYARGSGLMLAVLRVCTLCLLWESPKVTRT